MDVTHADIGIPTFQNKEVKLTDGSVKHFGRILKKTIWNVCIPGKGWCIRWKSFNILFFV